MVLAAIGGGCEPVHRLARPPAASARGGRGPSWRSPAWRAAGVRGHGAGVPDVRVHRVRAGGPRLLPLTPPRSQIARRMGDAGTSPTSRSSGVAHSVRSATPCHNVASPLCWARCAGVGPARALAVDARRLPSMLLPRPGPSLDPPASARGVHPGLGWCLVLQRVGVVLASLVLSLAMVPGVMMAGPSGPSSVLTPFFTPPVAFAQASGCTLLGAQGGAVRSNCWSSTLPMAPSPRSSGRSALRSLAWRSTRTPATCTVQRRSWTRSLRVILSGSIERPEWGRWWATCGPINEGVADLTFRGDGTLSAGLSHPAMTWSRLAPRPGGRQSSGILVSLQPDLVWHLVRLERSSSPGGVASGALRTVNPSTGLTTVVTTLNGAPAGTDRIVALAFARVGRCSVSRSKWRDQTPRSW